MGKYRNPIPREKGGKASSERDRVGRPLLMPVRHRLKSQVEKLHTICLRREHRSPLPYSWVRYLTLIDHNCKVLVSSVPDRFFLRHARFLKHC